MKKKKEKAEGKVKVPPPSPSERRFWVIGEGDPDERHKTLEGAVMAAEELAIFDAEDSKIFEPLYVVEVKQVIRVKAPEKVRFEIDRESIS